MDLRYPVRLHVNSRSKGTINAVKLHGFAQLKTGNIDYKILFFRFTRTSYFHFQLLALLQRVGYKSAKRLLRFFALPTRWLPRRTYTYLQVSRLTFLLNIASIVLLLLQNFIVIIIPVHVMPNRIYKSINLHCFYSVLHLDLPASLYCYSNRGQK